MNLQNLKNGDKLRYIGPPRDHNYVGETDHPSYYHNHVVIEITYNLITKLNPNLRCAWIKCFDPQGRSCMSSKILIESE